MAVQQSAGDVVMTVAEDRGSYGDGIAEDSLCGVTTAVDLRLYLFDNDASASFYRFHIAKIFKCNLSTPWYSRNPQFTYIRAGIPCLYAQQRMKRCGIVRVDNIGIELCTVHIVLIWFVSPERMLRRQRFGPTQRSPEALRTEVLIEPTEFGLYVCRF